jgi:hypothetical protein
MRPQMSAEPPSFKQPINGFHIGEGQMVRFEAIVSGLPQPEVTWFREGHQIHHSDDFQVTFFAFICGSTYPRCNLRMLYRTLYMCTHENRHKTKLLHCSH